MTIQNKETLLQRLAYPILRFIIFPMIALLILNGDDYVSGHFHEDLNYYRAVIGGGLFAYWLRLKD